MTKKITAPAMVYIKGEEMTEYVMAEILAKWIAPYVDMGAWKHFDLSVKHRDDTNDQVLKDAIAAGADIKAIFKEPTITPTVEQKKELGLKNTLGSPNGKMRQGWNGYSISRDTIIITGLEKKFGYAAPVLFDRHAVGGEYGAGYKEVGAGTLKTVHVAADGTETLVDERTLKDTINQAVTYHNPLDNVTDLGRHSFDRYLEAGVRPVVTTKKTVFKWQEPFWQILKKLFEEEYKAKFVAAGIMKQGEELLHQLTDDMAMKLIRWKEGNFGVIAHNYDGDWLTDELAQVHGSPGLISSMLCGVAKDGSPIREFEASHGTIADQNKARLEGKETSVNPIGMVDALLGALNHSAKLAGEGKLAEMRSFTAIVRESMYEAFRENKGTRDFCGPQGLNTEDFIAYVADKINKNSGALGKERGAA